MAMVWITRIIHSSPGMGNVSLLQNDPTWHPVIKGHQHLPDDPVVIGPGQILDCEFFAIPWAEKGRLNVSFGGNSLNYQVGPVNFFSQDHLRAFNANTGQEIGSAEMGPRGGGPICSIDVHLLLVNNRPEFQFHASSGTGAIDIGKVMKDLVELAAQAVGIIV